MSDSQKYILAGAAVIALLLLRPKASAAAVNLYGPDAAKWPVPIPGAHPCPAGSFPNWTLNACVPVTPTGSPMIPTSAPPPPPADPNQLASNGEVRSGTGHF